MKNLIDIKDLNKIIKNKNTKIKINDDSEKKQPKRTYYDRLNDAVNYGFSFKNDSISINNEKNECILKFENVVLISHNDLLRINFKMAYKYIKLWKDRVKNIVSTLELNDLDIFLNNKVKLEFLIKTKNNQTLDYDASVGCVKFIIDGLVESKILIDDSIEHIPLVLTTQKKVKDDISSIYIVIKKTSDEEIKSFNSDTFNSLLK